MIHRYLLNWNFASQFWCNYVINFVRHVVWSFVCKCSSTHQRHQIITNLHIMFHNGCTYVTWCPLRSSKIPIAATIQIKTKQCVHARKTCWLYSVKFIMYSCTHARRYTPFEHTKSNGQSTSKVIWHQTMVITVYLRHRWYVYISLGCKYDEILLNTLRQVIMYSGHKWHNVPNSEKVARKTACVRPSIILHVIHIEF